MTSVDVSLLDLMAVAMVSGRPSRAKAKVPLDSLSWSCSQRGAAGAVVFRIFVALFRSKELTPPKSSPCGVSPQSRIGERLHCRGCRQGPRREYGCSVALRIKYGYSVDLHIEYGYAQNSVVTRSSSGDGGRTLVLSRGYGSREGCSPDCRARQVGRQESKNHGSCDNNDLRRVTTFIDGRESVH